MGMYNRNTRDITCFGMIQWHDTRKTVQHKLEGPVFFCLQRAAGSEEQHSFLFFNEERSTLGVVSGSRTHLLNYDWLSIVWSRCGQPVTSIVTSRSPAPWKHCNKCINDARSLNASRKTYLNWTHQRNEELFLINFGRYRMTQYLFCALESLDYHQVLPVGESEMKNRKACAI